MNQLSRRSILALAALLASAPLAADLRSDDRKSPVSGRRLALRGYDPVAYFADGKPRLGSPEFSFAFDDSVYQFATAEHLTMFVADPEHYAPQYAGNCAIIMAKGAQKVESDPESWIIVDGKLFVFGDKSAVPQFEKDGRDLVARANGNWKTIQAGQ